MNDPRDCFAKELIKLGIPSHDAIITALDAGSSQVIINKKYFEEKQYAKNIIKAALHLTKKFYSGELFEQNEGEV